MSNCDDIRAQLREILSTSGPFEIVVGPTTAEKSWQGLISELTSSQQSSP